jgi:hypothetical protein
MSFMEGTTAFGLSSGISGSEMMQTKAETNKVTGANAGGARPLPVQMVCAARIAQFRR